MKSKLVKKCISVLMTVILITGLMAGCSTKTKESSNVGDNSIPEESVENAQVSMSFARTTDASVESNIFAQVNENWEDNRWNKLYKDELGVDVVYKWVATTAEQGTQKLNGAIASGDIPDVCQVDKTTMKQMAEAGLIIDIAPYFEKYASDRLKKLIADAGTKSIEAATFDGVQYGFPFVDCDLERADMLWLRQDWLDQSGLKAPESIDDLEAVMTAFQKIAGDGAIGMRVGNTANLPGFFNAYGVYPGAWTKTADGTLQYGKSMETMKEPLTKLADWYSKGLIDKEFYVKDDTAANERLVNSKCGVVYAWHAYGLWPLQDSVTADPNADWKPYSIVPSKAGDTVSPGISLATTSWYVVSANCKNPEKFIEMMNLYCEKSFGDSKEDYAEYINPGGDMEGLWRLSPVTINTPNKNQITTEKVIKAMEDGNTDDMNGEETNMYNFCKAFVDGDRSLWGWNVEFNQGGSQDVLIGYQKAGNLVYDEFYGAPTSSMSRSMTTIESILDEAIIKIISGQMSVDDYDKAIADWKAAGGEQITKEVNEWYSTK
ncbi:MAG: extracellular solute-binding protein [Anaerocolumna sp.]